MHRKHEAGQMHWCGWLVQQPTSAGTATALLIWACAFSGLHVRLCSGQFRQPHCLHSKPNICTERCDLYRRSVVACWCSSPRTQALQLHCWFGLVAFRGSHVQDVLKPIAVKEMRFTSTQTPAQEEESLTDALMWLADAVAHKSRHCNCVASLGL